MISLLLGITGHRDLVVADISQLRRDLVAHIEQIKGGAGASPIMLLTGLAEGADRLAAQVVLELGLQVVAVLPLPVAEYKKDFVEQASLDEFDELLGRASKVIVCPPPASGLRDDAYLAQGVYIAQHCQIMLALWDGVMPVDGLPAKGGTADIVRLCVSGLPDTNDNKLSLPEYRQVVVVPSARQSHAAKGITFDPELGKRYVERLQPPHISAITGQILAKFSEFNARARGVTAAERDNSVKFLRNECEPPRDLASLGPLSQVYAEADLQAETLSKNRKRAIKGVSVLALLAIFAQQVYSGPYMRWEWLAVHLAFMGAAFWAARQLFRGNRWRVEEQFLDWRALAEALRVQFFWRVAGITEQQVADHYLTAQRDELAWIRHAVRNQSLMATANGEGGETANPMADIQWVNRIWLGGQKDYFIGDANKAALNRAMDKKFSQYTRAAFVAGIGLTLATFIEHTLISDDGWLLNMFVLASGMSFVLAAVLATYKESMGFRELADSYQRMGSLYSHAQQMIEQAVAQGDLANAQKLLIQVGDEALSENAHWLQLHRIREFDVPVS